MLEKLKEDVLKANLLFPEYNLVTFAWGNVSEIDRTKNLVVIKPSGIAYEKMEKEKMVVVNLNGKVVEGDLKPSLDTATHLELYKNFPDIGGIVHTHSPWATSWAQAGKSIPCYGTIHADHFYGEVPCTREMKDSEIEGEYEKETGKVVVETFKNIDPEEIKAVLVSNHGPFVWGEDSHQAVKNSVVLEEIAKMAYHTIQINNNKGPIKNSLLDKHFLRKHGENSYYGQN